MKYYLHDSNSFNDEKVTELFIHFGYEGLGLFYTILEKLALQEKPVKTSVLKKQLFVGKKLEKCWNFLEEIELINTNNGETFNKQLMNFSGKYAIKKEKNAKRISEWRDKQEDTKNVTRYESVRNTCKVNKSKVNTISNDIEREKEKIIPPEFLQNSLNDLSETHDTILSDQPWLEIICMNNHLASIEIAKQYVSLFFRKLQNEGAARKSIADFKSHFARWLSIELQKQQKEKHGTKKTSGLTTEAEQFEFLDAIARGIHNATAVRN